ncbi:MAG: hypothetical protein ABSF45_18560 [Terriglobia bacterium]|jgi:hypothetical protein
MAGSYMDESFDRSQRGVFAVGGILGRGVAIFELERRWEQLLTRPDIGIGYFKASECQNGKGEFRRFIADPKSITEAERSKLDSISHEFLNLISHPVLFDNRGFICVQGVGVVQDDFYEVIKDPYAKAVLGPSPYRLAYDLAMIQCAWAMKQLGDGWFVSFVCDEHEKYGPFAVKAFENLKSKNPQAAEYMGTFSSKDDKTCAPLQAADAAVFEVRRALHLALKKRPGKLRSQFNVLDEAKAMFLITHSNKEQLLHLVSNHKPEEPFKLDSLMDTQYSENIRFSDS